MKALVIYDSLYSNTEKIARAIGGAIAGEMKVLRVGEANPAEIKGFDLLVIGSPTQGGRATKPLQEFITRIPADSLKGMKAATFDTRFQAVWAKIFGFAAGRMGGALKSAGANVVASEGFIVAGTKGPLKAGELERAANWAKNISES